MNVFPISSALLDSLVLAVTEQSDSYGYQITKDIQQHIAVSESTLYPVLRRLQKSGLLETYDLPYMGRNRRYYKITADGRKTLAEYRLEWKRYTEQIGAFLNDNKGDE